MAPSLSLVLLLAASASATTVLTTGATPAATGVTVGSVAFETSVSAESFIADASSYPAPTDCSAAFSITRECNAAATFTPAVGSLSCMCYTATDRYGDAGWRGDDTDKAFSQCFNGYSSLAAATSAVALNNERDAWKSMLGACSAVSPSATGSGGAAAKPTGNSTASAGAPKKTSAAISTRIDGQFVALMGVTLGFAGLMIGFL